MSLVSLANHHLARYHQPSRADGEVRPAAVPPPATRADGTKAPAPEPDDPAAFNSKVSTALEMLSRYIPTEVVALYLAALAAAPLAEWNAKPLYWTGIIATPIVLLLVYLSNARKGKNPLPKLGQWPLWKAVAATIAFSIWALAIPAAPYVTPPKGTITIGFAAIVASYVLSWLGNIIDPA
jgi:hypothetical protein